MELQKFIELVKTMRDAQKSYFKTKHRNALQRAIILEGLVDNEIKEYQQSQLEKAKQPTLFDNV